MEAIIQTGNRDSVPVKLDEYEVEKSVTDEKLTAQQSEQWEELAWEPRQVTAAFEDAIQSDATGEETPPETTFYLMMPSDCCKTWSSSRLCR